jgi:hypothetical protein
VPLYENVGVQNLDFTNPGLLFIFSLAVANFTDVNCRLVALFHSLYSTVFRLQKIKSYSKINRSEWQLPGNGQVEKSMKMTVDISPISERNRPAVPVFPLFPLFPTTRVTEGFGIPVDIFPCNISQHQHHYKNTQACTHH